MGLYDHIRRYFVRRILNFSAPRSRLICVNSYAIKFKTSVLLPLILNQLLNKSCRCQLSCLEILFLTIKRVRKLISLYFQVKVQKCAKHCQLEVVGSHIKSHTQSLTVHWYTYTSLQKGGSGWLNHTIQTGWTFTVMLSYIINLLSWPL